MEYPKKKLKRWIISMFFIGVTLHMTASAAQPRAAIAPSTEEQEADQSYIYAKRLLHEGQPREAVELFGKSLEIRTRILGDKNTKTVSTYAAYGEALRQSGESQRAVHYLTRAVPLAETMWGNTHRETLGILNNLASAYFDAGNLSEALRRQEALVKLSVEALGEEDADTLHRTTNLAVMMGAAGRRADEAGSLQQLWQRANASFGERADITMFIVSRYAASLTERGRYVEAEQLKRRNLALLRTEKGERHPMTLAEMVDLGTTLIGLRRYTEAIMLLDEAHQAQREVLGLGHFQAIKTLDNLAVAHYKAGRREMGTALMHKALNEQQRIYGAEHRRTLHYLANASAAELSLGRWDEALRMRAELIRRVETLRDNSFSADARRSLFQTWVGYYREYAAMLARNRRDQEAFRIAELTKARTLTEISAAQRALHAGLLSEEDRGRISQLEARVAALDVQAAALIGQPQKRGPVEAEKEAAARELSASIKELEKRYPKLVQLSEARVPDIKEAKALFPPDSVYINYLVQGNLFMVIALSPERGLIMKRPGLIPNLAHSVEAFRYLVSIPASVRNSGKGFPGVWRLKDGSYKVAMAAPEPEAIRVEESDDLAAYLGDKLLGPVAAHLRGARRIIISPDAELSVLPFDALRLAGRTVIETYEVQYTQSAAMYALSRARAADYARLAERRDLLSIGGAIYNQYISVAPGISMHHDILPGSNLLQLASDFDQASVPQAFKALKASWRNLPGSEREAERVANLFNASQVLLLKGKDASEDKLWQMNRSGELARFRYMLFATHGYLSPVDPRLNAVVLNQVGNSGAYDGFVTASEWPLYNLRTDLIVLSACNTGVGRVVQGEGIMGLPFALHIAGNHNAVLTLWAVQDNSTAEFVAQFFERVQAGVDHVTALAETKRAFLSSWRWKQPQFWAPFVLYGS